MAKRKAAGEGKPSNGSKYKWIVGILLAIIMALLGFAVAWGVQTANAGNTQGDVIRLEETLEDHEKENKDEHKELDNRIDNHDVMLMEQRTILQGMDQKLDEIKDWTKDHRHD
jgi:uncharacterized protein HemX